MHFRPTGSKVQIISVKRCQVRLGEAPKHPSHPELIFLRWNWGSVATLLGAPNKNETLRGGPSRCAEIYPGPCKHIPRVSVSITQALTLSRESIFSDLQDLLTGWTKWASGGWNAVYHPHPPSRKPLLGPAIPEAGELHVPVGQEKALLGQGSLRRTHLTRSFHPLLH